MQAGNKGNRTSHILSLLAENTQGDGDISINEILGLLGERAFGLGILVFSLPNSLPIPSPPGFSTITGIPIILLGLQMAFGRKTPWLPRRIGNYKIARSKFAEFLVKALPYIQKVERLLHPRLHFMHSKFAERIIGVIFLAFGVILSMPIPFANFLPGLSMSLVALGLIELDGALILGGILLGVFGTAFVLFTIGNVAFAALTNFF
jgi:hypothetical protein